MHFDLYRCGIVFELTAAIAMYSMDYEKNNKFWQRSIGCFLVLLLSTAVSIAAPEKNTGNNILAFMHYFILFFELVASFYFCYKIRKTEAMIIGLIAYITQHSASDIFMIIVELTNLDKEQFFFRLPYYILLIAVYGITYFGIYRVFWKRFKPLKEKITENYGWVIIFICVISFVIILNLLAFQYTQERHMRVICGLYDLIGTGFCFCVLLYMAKNDQLYNNVDSLSQMLKMKQENYDMWKENIELINIRSHDIRQQLSNMSDQKSGEFTKKMADQIEESIRIYDGIAKTGNEALDVALTEKQMYCDQNGIKMVCMADGSKMSFMENVDIYCIFSNILQNGIEAVRKLKNPEKRIISLTVITKGKLLCIQEENYFEGDIEFEQGLPVTTKDDKLSHGFGTKSIHMLVKKYGGDFVMRTEDDIFFLSIMIPLPD